MKFPGFILVAAAAAALSAPAFAADPAPAVLAGSCANCHGTDGKGGGAIPAIKGRPEEALLRQLQAFKAGTAPATVMGRLAKGYSDTQLAALAKHFAAQK